MLKPSTSFLGMGRDVGRRQSSHVSLITGWLKECHENHPNCLTSTDVALPTRVLDIGGDVVRLIDVALGQRGRYTALSHCWGGGIEIRTTKKNYAAQKEGLRYCDLPLSFRDATTVTRGLGLSDWEIESANMAAIYQNAYLVIGADMAPNSDEGFLDIQGGGYNGDGWAIATVDNDIIYARSEHRGNNNHQGAHPLDCEPLSARAWALQEQFLSSRMVHFASKEIIWECKSALRCECMELDREGHAPCPPLSLRSLTSSSESFPAKFREWYSLVDQVTYRSLTKSGDLLPCLSGMARQFQDSGAGAYLAGLWLEDLPVGLLWSSSPDRSRAVPYRGPSWSWTSIDQVTYPYGASPGFANHDNTFKKAYVKIIEAKCIPAGKDPLGAVSGGWLKVAAPLLKMEEDINIFPHYDSDEFHNEALFLPVHWGVYSWTMARRCTWIDAAAAMYIDLDV
ncbi:het-domain-containing protein [Fusarium flagelliforme]|uniref:Het-domain-containing protein n=1 Tax=Fusarium flagelliforme TaxID=2675880 RepID=A0A395MKR5_9HYPO|nr:het-domain-containing protein [Fusarium flagelliforme]